MLLLSVLIPISIVILLTAIKGEETYLMTKLILTIIALINLIIFTTFMAINYPLTSNDEVGNQVECNQKELYEIEDVE